MTFLCQGSFNINSSNITGHQRTVISSKIHVTLFVLSPRPCCVAQIFDRTETILFVKNFPWGWTEFAEFSTFIEIPEYSRFVILSTTQTAGSWQSILSAELAACSNSNRCCVMQMKHAPKFAKLIIHIRRNFCSNIRWNTNALFRWQFLNFHW